MDDDTEEQEIPLDISEYAHITDPHQLHIIIAEKSRGE